VEWVKLRTSFYRDPKVMGLPDAESELLFIRSLAFAGEQETHGFIPEHVLPALARKRRYDNSVRALLAQNLWQAGDGGYWITRWDENQDELEKLAARRAADRERKRKQRATERSYE
jgi:hypothetical protein